MLQKGKKVNLLKKEEQQTNFNEYSLSKSLEVNIKLLKQIFVNDDTLIERHFENQKNTAIKCSILLIEGMVKLNW